VFLSPLWSDITIRDRIGLDLKQGQATESSFMLTVVLVASANLELLSLLEFLGDNVLSFPQRVTEDLLWPSIFQG
jgi:hypothetical protein